jgi:hypothetical protein
LGPPGISSLNYMGRHRNNNDESPLTILPSILLLVAMYVLEKLFSNGWITLGLPALFLLGWMAKLYLDMLKITRK